ncbi:MAG TPA: F0F1 ATP synthase subunit epsilon [Gemmatimonadales bacterium]|nr:F0F1 ATP synthase subunit epsilon [Gemmatimonadales bacterium]
MRLRAVTPTEVVVETEVRKVVASGTAGSFCVLPRHRDLVALLAPGLLAFESPEGHETFMALDEGVLLKAGPEVWVSSWKAFVAGDLGQVREAVQRQLVDRSEREHRARQALARLEAELVRRLGELRVGSGV